MPSKQFAADRKSLLDRALSLFADVRPGEGVTALLLALALLFAAFYMPEWLLRDFGVDDSARLFELKIEVVRTMWQFVLGIGGAIALYVAWRRVKAMDRQTEIAQEGHITERFTRAIDQLGARNDDGMARPLV